MGIYSGNTEIKNIVMGPSPKSMQGPCPTGFHIPKYDEFVNLHNIGVNIGAWANDGIGEKELLKIPLAGYRDAGNSAIFSQGGDGIYRCSEADGTQAKRIGYSSGGIILNYISWRAQGSSIRPFKDTPVVPDSGWTTLYAGTGDAGIFHDSGNGLISLSSDGVNWITIADKNLGATTVWNNGDTLNQNNCGKYYQRGNNYGFSRTGSVTTSGTQVDASNYGPGNYYSSSTFTTGSAYPRNWDSSDNRNLRGGQYTPVKEVYVGTKKVRPNILPYLCFTANTANSMVGLGKSGNPTAVTLEISTDGITWTDYTIGNTITLSNIGDKVYWRNKSGTQTALNTLHSYYQFVMTGSIAASGDIGYMLCKNCTQTLSDKGCFHMLFYGCTSLTSTPTISFTTDSGGGGYFVQTFQGCSNITTLPKLPLTTLQNQTYQATFNKCSKIKLSTTQDSNYTQPYKIPREGTGTVSGTPFTNMFANTGGSFTGTPSANTTYYLHKDNTIV